jgi:hypothetical protein
MHYGENRRECGISWDIIQDHPIVQEWRHRFMTMNSDLYTLFGAEGLGFIHRMGINNVSGVEKWGAACTMGLSIEFRDELNNSFPINLMTYVRQRVFYVLECLNEIRGDPHRYVRYKYIKPWETLLGPDNVF